MTPRKNLMTMNSTLPHKSNYATFCRDHLAITGSDLLISTIVSLSIFESPFEMYRMHNSLKIAGRQEAPGGEG